MALSVGSLRCRNISGPGGNFQGTARAFQQSLDNQPWLILAALVAIYIVLGVL